jgi:hypothetical protein
VAPGQQVELRSEITGNTVVHGVVQRLQHEADLLKNTLQVKVQLLDAPEIWRPETLCRARFLGSERAPDAAATAFLVPKAALRGDAVFVFDPAQRRARRVPVTTAGEEEGLAVVRGELSPAQHVILVEVADGEKVREEVK